MPNTHSATKALRQNKRRRAHNAALRKTVRAAIKGYQRLIPGGKVRTEEKLPAVYQALDKAAKAGVINRNRAARMKSRLAKTLRP